MKKLSRRIEFKKSGHSDFEGVLEMFTVYPNGVEEFNTDNYFEMTVESSQGEKWDYKYICFEDMKKMVISWIMS